MILIKKWIKNHLKKRKRKTKSVRFTTNKDIYYTHSSIEYDRSSMLSFEDMKEGESLKMDSLLMLDDNDEFDKQVIRNTKLNKKQGYHSIAVLVNYRANI